MKKVLPLLAFLLLPLFASAYPLKSAPAPPLRFSQVFNAPAGTRTDWAVLRGKVVVIEFWATWCGPCVAAIPHWNELGARLDPKKFQLITVDQSERAEKVSEFLQRKPMAGWAGVDGSGVVSKAYGVSAIPATMIVDQRGRFVAATTPEHLSADDLNAVFDGQKRQFGPPPEENRASVRIPKAAEAKSLSSETALFEIRLTSARPGTDPFTGVVNDTFEKRAVSAMDLIADAWQVHKARIDWLSKNNQGFYNLRVTMPGLQRLWSFALYQQDVTLALRVHAHKEQETRRVLVLRTTESAHALLKDTSLGPDAGKLCGYDGDRFVIQNVGLQDAAQELEKLFGIPVVNETAHDGRVEVSVAAREGDLPGLKEALAKQAGLALTEETRPVEMLVVEDEPDGTSN